MQVEPMALAPPPPPTPARLHNKEVWAVVDSGGGYCYDDYGFSVKTDNIPWVGQPVWWRAAGALKGGWRNGRLTHQPDMQPDRRSWKPRCTLYVAYDGCNRRATLTFFTRELFLGWRHGPQPPSNRQRKRVAKWKAEYLRQLRLSERARILIVFLSKFGKGYGGGGFYPYVVQYL